MTEFTFRAPPLYDETARPSEALQGALHDAPGLAGPMAKTEKFARWLITELKAHGLQASGPGLDESCWIVEVKSDHGFTCCFCSGDADRFHVLVVEYGDATKKVADAVEAILSNTALVSDLRIDR